MLHKDQPSGTSGEPRTANRPPGRPTWAEVDLAAIIHNYRALQSLLGTDTPVPDLNLDLNSSFVIRHSSFKAPAHVPPPRLIPVIKANAYGHGAVNVARALSAAGATAFAVALVEEGIELRGAGIREEILVLEGAWPGQEAELVRCGLTAAVHSPDGVRRLDREARAAAKQITVHVKVDTGMSRLGAAWDAMDALLEALQSAAALRVGGVFSHLAGAEEEDSAYTREQMRRFRQALDQFGKAGLGTGEIHFANSAGLLFHAPLRAFTARPGIALYGYPPARERCPIILKPALTLKTRIGRIHSIRMGESAGYNRRFIARRDTRAATLPIGYADGYSRGLTGIGRVIIRNRWAPVLGAVSMDLIVVDVTDLPEAREEDEVILMGSTADCRMDAASWAKLLHTIPYEVLCAISSRVPRLYRTAPAAPSG